MKSQLVPKTCNIQRLDCEQMQLELGDNPFYLDIVQQNNGIISERIRTISARLVKRIAMEVKETNEYPLEITVMYLVENANSVTAKPASVKRMTPKGSPKFEPWLLGTTQCKLLHHNFVHNQATKMHRNSFVPNPSVVRLKAEVTPCQPRI